MNVHRVPKNWILMLLRRIAWKFPKIHRRCCLSWIWCKCSYVIFFVDIFMTTELQNIKWTWPGQWIHLQAAIVYAGVNRITYWFQGVASLPHKCQPPLPSARQHLCYGDFLEVKREYYQNCSVLGCMTQCSQSAAHSYEQFLQVQQIGFVTLQPLRHA